jgi:hypothetical protein
MSGIRNSGFRVIRVDSIVMRHASRGLIVATGKRRNRRHRLSTDGVMRAEKIARELIARSDNPQEGAGDSDGLDSRYPTPLEVTSSSALDWAHQCANFAGEISNRAEEQAM